MIEVLQCGNAITLGTIFPKKLVIYVQVFVAVTKGDVFPAI